MPDKVEITHVERCWGYGQYLYTIHHNGTKVQLPEEVFDSIMSVMVKAYQHGVSVGFEEGERQAQSL